MYNSYTIHIYNNFDTQIIVIINVYDILIIAINVYNMLIVLTVMCMIC